jgi:UDP-glucuronate decarboxylase
MQKRILITGAAGFLGSNLCEMLLNEGHYIIALDNLMTGSLNNLSEFMDNENFEFIEHDIVNPIDINVDEIYNLACPASPPFYQKDPVYTTKISVFGAINMLDLAKKYGAKILQASTSEVYGDPQVHPQPESYRGAVNPIGIRACYDEGKRCAESLFFDYHREYGVEIKVMRIFNTYGPRMNPDDGRVVSNFIVQALKGIDITMYGDGTQTRSFCYVDDNLNGMVALMNSGSETTGPINIGNPVEFTMLELAEKVLEKIESKSKIVFQDLPSDDPLQRKPVIEKAKQELNWEPKIFLDEGLERSIEYFKKMI